MFESSFSATSNGQIRNEAEGAEGRKLRLRKRQTDNWHTELRRLRRYV